MSRKLKSEDYYNEIIKILVKHDIRLRQSITKRTKKKKLIELYDNLVIQYPSDGGAFDVVINGKKTSEEKHAQDRKESIRTVKKRVKEDGYLIKADQTVTRSNIDNLPLLIEEFNLDRREARRIVREQAAPEDVKRVKTLEGVAVKMSFVVDIEYDDVKNEERRTLSPISDDVTMSADFFQDEKQTITARKSYIKTLIHRYMDGQISYDMLNDPDYFDNFTFTISQIRSGSQSLTLDMKDMIIRESSNLTVYNKGIESFEPPPEFCQTFKSLHDTYHDKEQDKKIKAQTKRRQKKIDAGLVDEDYKIRALKPAPKLSDDDIDYLERAQCMVQYLLLMFYQFITPAYLRPYGDLTPAKLKTICEDKHINYRALDIEGNIINTHYEETRNRKNRKTLTIVVYNNHIYTIKDVKLFKKNKRLEYDSLDNIEYIERVDNKDMLPKLLIDFLKRHILPELIFKGSFLKAIIYDGITYTNNKRVNMNFDILQSKGLLNYFDPIDCPSRGIAIALKHYKPPDVEIIDNKKHKINNICYSYAPCFMDIKAQQYYYSAPEFRNTNENDNTDSIINGLNNSEILTIDMNKAYSTSLRDLPFLPGHDTTKHKVYKYTGQPLIPHFLYNVHVTHKHVLIPRSFPFTGYFIQQIRYRGCNDFKIVEVLECMKCPNYYTEIINNLYDKHGQDAKVPINSHIGKMASYRRGHEVREQVFIKLCTEDEANRYKGPQDEEYIIKRDESYNGYVAIFKLITHHPVRIKNNIVLNHMIKDMTRLALFDKMLELGIPTNKILQVKVDSIMFIKDKTKFEDIKDIGPDLGQWKREPLKPLQRFVRRNNIKYKFTTDLLDSSDRREPVFNPLGGYFDGYAGAGKSHFIKNVLIPKVEGDYIVLTSQHSINASYLKIDPITGRSYNSEIIHYYLFNPKVEIKERHIIVDEIGLFPGCCLKVLDRLKLQGHIIHMFGDYRQCRPVNSKGIENNQYLISALATEGRPSAEHKRNKTNYYFMSSNWRNRYTPEDYENILNSDKKQLKQMIKNHNIETLERCERLNIIITDYVTYFRNDKTDKNGNPISISSLNKLNDKVMKDLKINEYSTGCRMVCKTNTLRKNKDYENLNTDAEGYNLPFYNNQDFTVSDIIYDEEHPEALTGVLLTDGVNSYKVYISDYDQYFQPYYAKTIYNVQGESLDNFIISEEPADLEMFISDPRMVYTLLSRQKTAEPLGMY